MRTVMCGYKTAGKILALGSHASEPG